MSIKRTMITLFFVLLAGISMAQTKTITGTVSDETGISLPGVSIIIVGTARGTITDIDGRYSILADPADQLQFRFVGMQTQTLTVGERTTINVVLRAEVTEMEQVVVVGYGVQKRESVVGSITQTTGEELKRAVGGSDLANSITGLMPGVITIKTSGIPGGGGIDDRETEIYIRGQTTWNEGQPLILVDGIERRMMDVDPNEVENISVLKDASATAVFGVKGANGVILVTTKRGATGKPKLSYESSVAASSISKLPSVLNSYDVNTVLNRAIENAVPADENAWKDFVPWEILQYYKTQEYPELYPDVNWTDEMSNDFAWSHRHNLNVNGGTDFVKYFLSLGYLYEGDIMRTEDFGQGYDPDFKYERYNFRSNLDFSITKTTTLGVNLAGYYGSQQRPEGGRFDIWKGLYGNPPDMYPIRYADGTYADTDIYDRYSNAIYLINFGGLSKENRSEINTDFILTQKLDVITKGLTFKAKVSYDNRFISTGPNISDEGLTRKYISPGILDAKTAADSAKYITYKYPQSFTQTSHGYNYVGTPLSMGSEYISNSNANNIYRSLFYELSLNYARNFGDHAFTGLFLLNRRENTTGSNFTNYREDWVGRATYDYAKRYFLEFNGAYNGSEKFDLQYRFGFFPSLAGGWMLSNENFFRNVLPFANVFKIRYSWGKVGNDQGIARWQYVSGWDKTNITRPFGAPVTQPGYPIYLEAVVANPDIRWETAEKQNIGLETGFFKSLIAVNFDYFWEHRYDMFINSDDRTSNIIFGATLPSANIGELRSKGWELEVKFSKAWPNSRLWSNYHWSRATDEVIFRDDPELRPDYQKLAGYPIGQTRTQLYSGIIQSWDEMYTGVVQPTNTYYLPGDHRIVDYNADGTIDANDNVPYMYPNRPEYTYGWTLGYNYKGFSAMAQFYGVYNVSGSQSYGEFHINYHIAYDLQLNESWSPEAGRTTGDNLYKHVRYNTGSPNGHYWVWDYSYFKLQNAEISYTFTGNRLNKAGISQLRVFLNGNNLWLWNKTLEDRDRPKDQREYPVLKRYNCGVNVTF